MRLRLYRLRLAPFLLVVAVAASLAATARADAAPGKLVVDRGVVQWVANLSLSLTELDGTTVSFQVDPAAPILLNGQPAPLGMIRPGFIAQVSHNGNHPASKVAAWGRAPKMDIGEVMGVAPDNITLQLSSGAEVIIRVDIFTVVRRRSSFLSIDAVRPGWMVKVFHPTDPLAPASRIVLLYRLLPHLGRGVD